MSDGARGLHGVDDWGIEHELGDSPDVSRLLRIVAPTPAPVADISKARAARAA